MHGTVWFGLSAALSSGSVDPGATILASWSDGHGLVRYREEVRAEIEAILEGTGTRLRWSDTAGEPGPEGVVPVVVVVTPSEPAGAGWHISPSAMGVYLSNEQSTTIFVFYHRVARVLGASSERDGIMNPSEGKRLAKAVGRVVVHELVHRVAPDLPHADSGVMRADLGRSDSTRGRLPLDDGSRFALLAALREARLVAETANHLSPGPRTK